MKNQKDNATPVNVLPDSPKQEPGASVMPPAESSRTRVWVVRICRAVVLVLSLALILYISYDTFNNRPFLSNHTYMTFQLWVCVAFMADFFIELAYADNKYRYVKSNWLFFFISIPYLNLINLLHIDPAADVIYYLRFVPLIRGAYALVIVVGYISTNRATSLLSQYLAILLTSVYILSLLFYYEEYGLNPNVKTFWDVLYWSMLYVTTIGGFAPVTVAGKVISVVLPLFGMMMLPMITVFFSDKIHSIAESNIQK